MRINDTKPDPFNRDNMILARDYLQTIPGRFTMVDWLNLDRFRGEDGKHECRTAGCVAGWIAFGFSDKIRIQRDSFDVDHLLKDVDPEGFAAVFLFLGS